MPPLLRLLRPHQYAKNLLVFAAPGAAGLLGEPDVVAKAMLAFVLFSAVSSLGYVVNDMMDVEADRAHPTKKHRPIASGEVSAQHARLMLVLLAVPAAAFSVILGTGFMAALGGYAAVSLTYSTFLKRIPWIELLAVSAGFLIRAVAGGAATATPISGWFLLVVSAGALLVITGKRLGELLALGGRSPTRKVLAGYQLKHLRLVAVLVAVIAVACYGAWAAAEAENQAAGSNGSPLLLLRLTIAPFVLAIGRYLVLSWRGDGETPESLIVRDRIMLAAGVAWVVIYSIGRYL